MTPVLPSLDILKTQAKALRRSLASQGRAISHAQALELIAHQHGARDWNTLHARAGNRPVLPFAVGQRVKGRYLNQPFVGTIVALNALGDSQFFGLKLDFDAPVDVITFDSMSNFRSRVNVTVDRAGRTAEKTSDGQPHLVLEM